MRERRIVTVVMAVGVLLGACGDAGSGVHVDDVASAPRSADEPVATREPDERIRTDPPLLAGVPESCSLLADHDADAEARLVEGIAAEIEHGPFVVVERDGARVAATTTYEEPGVEYRAAAWRLLDGAPTAINEEAARISSLPTAVIDSAGEDPEARAMAEAEDCSFVAADRSAEDPPEPEPQLRPELLVVDPEVASPGERIALRFPEATSRGIAFQLDRRTADGWETTHWMTSDANGERYAATEPVSGGSFDVIDVGVGGEGPDHVTLPDTAPAGAYRICTSNAGDEFCGLLEIRH